MARVKFNAGEIDQQFQIEDGIRRTLQGNESARVRAFVIETAYCLFDKDGNAVAGSLVDKCQAISNLLDVEYSLRDQDVVFKKKPR